MMQAMKSGTMLRLVSLASRTTSQRRNLAILPTVKTATDTSAMEFLAPSHVSLSSQAAEISRQISDFYANPDSVIELDAEMRKEVQDEVTRKVRLIPHIDMSEVAGSMPEVPQEVRLGDNPLFHTFAGMRNKK